MPAPCPLTSSLALLVLLGTARAGPFSPRSNVTLPAPRPPPQPGGRAGKTGGGSPSSQLYEHTVEGGEKQVVFTHRINLPTSAGCGCPPGTEPPAPASEVQALRTRLEILEELVKGLKEQCTGGCCPATAQAGTGQRDVRSLCSLHGVFDLSRCACSCEPGWGGPTCSDPTDAPVTATSAPSASASCPDDCNDQGRCVRGRCVCFPGYSGPSCGWPSCPGDCRGRGRCVQGVCVCRAGFSGDDCGTRACPRGCSQRGRCEDGRCVCDPGYTGEDCGLRSCPRGCSQRGRCEDGRCVCKPGYTGEDCGTRACPRGCSQRGRCQDGRCVCDPGYTGEDCGTRVCPRDCGEGGRCVDGRCVCWTGYAGEDCGSRTCPRDCHGRGRCEDGECICHAGYSGDDCGVRSCPGDCSQRGRCEDGRCVCWPGYAGPDCGARACPRDCRGRGRCENGVCVCHAGYSGEDCGVRSCPGDCSQRGRCESGRCVCWPGYTGRDCGARACPGDCRGRGRCVDGRCVCDPGFAGEDCGSRRCPGDCRARGRCEDGVCVCDPGYEGEDCGARSCPGGCRGRGQCLDGRCVCDDGYEGEDCGVRRCPRDCSQHGVCQDGACACWEGYAGEDCGLRTCPANCHRRGRCEDGRCVCDAGYTGPACATRICPNDCRGRGRCVQGACVCHAGFGGEDCGREEPPASACPGGCGPRELCRAGQCVCVEGFRGPDCAVQTCPGDCRGRGDCREGSCVCREGYAGEDCGEEVPAVEGMRMHLLEETTVRTEWTRAPGPVDAYEIQFTPTMEGASPPFTARVPSSASAYDQRGLAPGQEYQVSVRALRGTSWGPPASKTITTMIDGPQDLRVVAVTPTTLELSWLRPQAEVDRFVVSFVSAGNQRVRLEVPPTADGTLLTDLMPGVEYVVTVTAERGRAVSYPTSVRANTAPGQYSYPEVRPPAAPHQPRPAPAPRPSRPPRPAAAQDGEEAPPQPQPPRRAWGNLTAELGRLGGSVHDLERQLRARGYPLRANQTYAAVARQLHAYLQRRQAAGAPAPPAPPPRRARPTAGPDPGAWRRDPGRSGSGPAPEGGARGAAPHHPKPEVLGSSADGALLVSLDGLRGQFERVVLRWWPQPPAEGPRGELAVPGSTRTVRLPDLRPGTAYHVEAHGVRAGQTSKSYALLATTGSSPSGLLGATDEPPPSGPSTTQGARAPLLQQRPQELGELRVLGRDETGRLRVTWTAQPDTFAHFRLHLRVPEGPGDHEELLPGHVRQALVPPPPPGSPYELSLHGVPPRGTPSAPLVYQGIMDRDEEPGKPPAPPRLGELTVTDVTPDSLWLQWTVPEGEFDSFVVQYKDRDRPQVVPVEGPQRAAPVTSLEPGRKYKFVLYGLVGKKRHGPLVAEAKTLPRSDPRPGTPPRLGQLWVTDPTPDSLRLSWTVPEGQFDSFTVQYRDRAGRPQAVPVEGPERSVLISPLDPGHKYRFTLYGVANRKRYGPLTADGATAPETGEEPPRPEQPLLGELTVAGVTPDSLRLSWTVARGPFDSFVVQYKDAQGRPQAVPVGGDESEVTVPGLEPARKYRMNLYGLRGGQRVGPVSVAATTDTREETPAPTEEDKTPAPTEPPTEPTTESPAPPAEPLLGELAVTAASPDSLSLAWTVPRGRFDAFSVQYKDSDGWPQAVRAGGEERAVTVRGLEPGRKYKLHLYGLHGGRRVGPVAVVGLTAPRREEVAPPATEAPQEPRLGELTVTGVTPDSVGLSWTVPEGEFDSFVVQYKDRDGQPRAVPVAADQRAVTVPGLEPAHEYQMDVFGVHGGRHVGPLSAVAVTAPLPPTPAAEPPREPRLGELAVTGVTADSVGLSWTVPKGEFDSFVVQYKDRDGQPRAVPVDADLRAVTVPGLEPSRKYKLLLFGIQDGKRRGPVSVEAKTAARGDASPGTPPRLGELWVTDRAPDSLRLSWTVPEGHFDSFVVQFKDRDGPRTVPVDGHERSVTVAPLDPGRKYRFLLYGLLGRKRHGPLAVDSAPETRQAEDGASAKPRLGEELTVTGVTADSVGLSWTVPEGEFDSFVVQYKDRDGQPRAVPVEGGRREALVSGLVPASRYKLLLYGLHAGRRLGPLAATAVTAPREDPGGRPRTPAPPAEPRLGELTVEEATPHALRLSWTAGEGRFDSFEVHYTDTHEQRQVVRLGGDRDEVTISGLEPDHRYLVTLYGFHDGQRVGPAHAEAWTASREKDGTPPGPAATASPAPPAKPRLGELTVTDAAPDALGLSWTVPEGRFDHFLVQYKNGDGQPKALRVPGHEAAVTVSGLEPDHKYKLNLFGFHGGQRVGPVSVVGVTAPEDETPAPTEEDETPAPMEEDETPIPTEPPTEPTTEPPAEPLLGELAVTGASPDSLSLAWTVPRGRFDAFSVQYKDSDGRPQAVRAGGEERAVTVRGLEPGRKYKLHLYGLHEGRRVGPMAVVGLTAPAEPLPPAPPPPTAPQGLPRPRLGELTVTDAAPDALGLSWTVPEGRFDHFLVQYKNGDGQPKALRVPGHEAAVTVSGLEPDHKYKLNLFGFHGGQRVGPVSVVGVTALEDETPLPTEPPTEPPAEPLLGELAVTAASPDSLSLAWTVPRGRFDAFSVQYKDRDGRPQAVRAGGEERAVTVRGLEPGRKYKLHLYGLHGGRRVGPVAAVGLTAPQERVDETPAPTEEDETPAPTEEDETPTEEDETPIPTEEDETPIPTEPPTEPTSEPPAEPLLGELAVTAASLDSLSLAWTVPRGRFDAFSVQYKDSNGRPQAVRAGGEERAVTVRGLEPGRKYKLHLYGLHGGRRVGPVAVVGLTEKEAVTTPVLPTASPAPPTKPRLGELTVTDAAPDALGLSWTVPEGRFDHFLVQYKNGDGQPKALRVPGHEAAVTVSGLEPDHKYKLNLFGFHGGQRVGPVSVVGVTAPEDETPAPTEEDETPTEEDETPAPTEEDETPIPTEPPTEPTTEPHAEPLLGELAVTGASPDSLSLAWTVPRGRFDAFSVQYKDRDGRPQAVRAGGEERAVTVRGLEPGRKYKLHLYGLHEGRRVGPMAVVGLTEKEAVTTPAPPTASPAPPAKPRLGELTVTDATPDALGLSWTVPEGRFDHFLVQYKNGDGQPKALRVPGHEAAVTVSGLEPDHKYKLNLFGFHGGQRVGPVSVVGVTAPEDETPAPTEEDETPTEEDETPAPTEEDETPIPTEPPTEPTTEPPAEPLLGELAVTAASPDSLSLAWTVPQGRFDAFSVQYKDRDGQPQAVRAGGEERAVTVRGLEPGRKYKLHLYGLHEGRRVGPMAVVGLTAALPTEPPLEPRLGELAGAAVAPDTVRLSWTVAQGAFDSFLVQFRDAHGQPQTVPAGGDLREASVAGLDPARKYKFLLFGLRDGRRHGPVSVEAKTLPDTKPSPRLGELTVTGVTPDSVGLSWTVPEGEFDSFVVQYKDRDGQPHAVPVAADQRAVTVPGLEPNRRYKFLLYGLAGRRRLGPAAAEGTTAPREKEQPPPRLGDLAVTDETSDSLRLSWTVAQGPFDSFVVQYRDPDGQPQAVPVAGEQRTVTIAGLQPGRKYKFLLYGLLGGKRLGPATTLGETAREEDTPAAPPPATQAPPPPEEPLLGALAVTDRSPDALRLSWTVARGAFDSFVVQYRDAAGQPQALLVGGDQSQLLVSGLEPSTSYAFSLYGLRGGRRLGPVSAEGTTGQAPAGQTPGEPGPRVSQLSVTDVTTSSLRLTWEAPPGAFDSFLLRFGVPSLSTLDTRPRPLLQRELTVPGPRRSAVLRDLKPGTLYSLTLYGLRGPHKADSVQGTARTLSPVLESPHGLQFSDVGETSAKVSWTPPPSRVDGFKVSYQLADGGEPQSVQVDGQTRTQTLRGLVPGARYEVTVVSVRGFEESEPLTGFLTTVPDGPTQLRALNLTEGSALLHWKAPQKPVDTYNVRVSAPGAPPVQGSAPGVAVDYPLSGLELHTNYTATVRGLRGPNFTSPASITFTTGLDPPQDLEAKEVTPRSALLTWTEPQTPPTGYLLSFDTPGWRTQEILLPGGLTSHRLGGLFPSTRYSARLRAMWGESFSPPVATSFTTGGLRIPFPRDCGEEMQNGAGPSRTTTIFLNGNRERPLSVFCDMETDQGGWLVFQRRMDGQTDFWRDWEDYAQGFGNVSREFWLGNEALHSLTQAGDYSMRVDLRAGAEAVFAQYDSFRVASAADFYRLHLEGYHGTAGDSMSYHSGSVFSTRDRDPNNLLISCAVSYRGAWWYKNCHYANLNGLYGSTVDHQGVSWYDWKGFEFSVPFTEMKLRPRSYRPPAGGG
ncbi:LOW QUALITY PROTEIN: tenascin-X [Dasypus novemcinctus]|uniref:LOW QUALITY PROTEIN: tenascin-X n=1 Tax=Dasypus novemcinctus TaxID=9361 RepID=UPI00265EC98D|nr:LOW QUALITY PROTEIN: tenascin-X [Dasypus novemcinctus]